MDETFKKAVLVIFESLDDDEKKTGEELFQTAKNIAFREPNFQPELHKVNSKEEFLETLNQVVKRAKDECIYFFVHFEIHGETDGKGVVLNNGELVTWKELMPIFIELNVFYRNYLCITLAVCGGLHILEDVNPEDRAPFRVVIAHPYDVDYKDILRGFDAFYSHFFFSIDVLGAIEKYDAEVSEDARMSVVRDVDCVEHFKKGVYGDRETIRAFLLSQKDFLGMDENDSHEHLEQVVEDMYSDPRLSKDHFLMKDLK